MLKLEGILADFIRGTFLKNKASKMRTTGKKKFNLMIFISILLLFGLIGCGLKPTPHQEAAYRCWKQGYQDAAAGEAKRSVHTPQRFGELPLCSGIDYSIYEKGWQDGKRAQCTPAAGWKMGRMGKKCYSCCPAQLHEGFSMGWEKGIESYCTSKRAYEHGRSGKKYLVNCPKEKYNELYDAYSEGVSMMQKELALKHDIMVINREVNRLEEELAFLVSNEQLSEANQTKTRIHALNRERRYLEDSLRSYPR